MNQTFAIRFTRCALPLVVILLSTSNVAGQVREIVVDRPFITDVDVSPNGKWVAVASNRGIGIYEVDSGERTHHLGSPDIFRSVHFSPIDDGSLVAMRDGEGNLKVAGTWDFQKGAKTIDVIQFDDNPDLFQIEFGSAGRDYFGLMMRTDEDRMSWMEFGHWSSMGNLRQAIGEPNVSFGFDFCLFDKGQRLALVRNQIKPEQACSVDIYDTNDWTKQKSIKLLGGFGASIDIDSEQSTILVGGAEPSETGIGRGLYWRIDMKSTEPAQSISLSDDARFGLVRQVKFHPTGKQFALATSYIKRTRSYEAVIPQLQLRETASGETIWNVDGLRPGDDSHIDFTPDGKKIVFARNDSIHLLETASGEGLRSIQLK